MAVDTSSANLHPRTGARFIFERDQSAPNARYDVLIYLCDGRKISGVLEWRESRTLWLDDAEADDVQDEPLAWARGETVKLARVLKSSGQARLTRWRG